MFSGVSEGRKDSLFLDVFITNDGSKNEFLKDCLMEDGFVS